MQEVSFRAGERIFTEGEPGSLCFKIASGRVDILLRRGGLLRRRDETIASCGSGDIIGAMSVIAKGVRSASAMAAEPTVCTAYEPG